MSVTLLLNATTWYGAVMGRKVVWDQAINWSKMRGVGVTLSMLDVHGNPSDRSSFKEGPFQLVVHSMQLVR